MGFKPFLVKHLPCYVISFQLEICACENNGTCISDGIIDLSANPLIFECLCQPGTTLSIHMASFCIVSMKFTPVFFNVILICSMDRKILY